jgi:uncharacterized membrane protein
MNPMILVHVAGGSVALLSGAAALSMRKGGPLHAGAGTVFFASMLVLAGTGAWIAALRPERGTMVIGLFTAYLVVTSWVTARHRDGRAGRFELFAFLFASACAIALAAFGLIGAAGPNGRFDSLPAAIHFPFAAVAALAAGLDLNFLLRRDLIGTQRVARHVWRMCAALLIAAFSFFLGQQDQFPRALRGSPIWYLPPLAVLAAMVFWLLRVRFSRAFRHFPPRRGAQELAHKRRKAENAAAGA